MKSSVAFKATAGADAVRSVAAMLPVDLPESAYASELATRPRGERVRTIIERAAARHQVSVDDLLGPSRRKSLVVARWEAIRIVAVVFPDFSLPHLGDIFKRDHSSIMYALGRLPEKNKAKR